MSRAHGSRHNPILRRPRHGIALVLFVSLLGAVCHEPVGRQTFASPQSQPIVLSRDGTRLYVARTTTNRVAVFDAATRQRLAVVDVGIEPVSLALRPPVVPNDPEPELWVSNHVSDSVSVIDVAPGSGSLHQVVETIQAEDTSGVTLFDEPVGIAFADNQKAYVALSSRDQIAVIDATTYSVQPTTLDINAQEPRAIRVRDGRLYVLPFESGNQSELSSCPNPPFPISATPGSQCTFDQADHNFATNPQLVDAVVDLVVDPDVPDRDLYVYDTSNDTRIQVVSGIGTLLYGLAVGSAGQVFIAQTDARNAVNGQAGTSGHGLDDLQNRIFLNQLARVDCGGSPSLPCGAPTDIDLEEPPGSTVTVPLATPYGIEISDDDSTLVVTAAASSRIFTFDTSGIGMGDVLDTLDVGAIPRGVALRSDPDTGAPLVAYVLNSLDDTVSVVDISDPANLSQTATITVGLDSTPPEIRRGRIAFNDASASTSGTFSCASCHPDGNTDQLLWVIGARCTFQGCDQEEVRSTMPVRGLRDTLPLHWDGVLGDPFGGTNGETQTGLLQPTNLPPNCGPNGGGGNCFRHLVNASLSGVMCDQASCPTNEIGLPGDFSEQDRDDMAAFLENVSYPPARSRPVDDAVSAQAVAGFEDFFFDQGGGGVGPRTCADAAGGCHALPFTAGSNSAFVGGFDAPTMRGMTDRWLQFSVGITNIEEQLVLTQFVDLIDGPPWTPALGFDEFTNWKLAFGSAANPGAFRAVYNVGPFDIFQMIEEMSTGHSGALGRQVTLNTRTAGPALVAETDAQLAALELADGRGLVNLRGVGLRDGSPVTFSYSGLYRSDPVVMDRTNLLAEAATGQTLVTFTAQLGENAGKAGFEPPALAVPSVGNVFSGQLDLPQLPGDDPMQIRGLHVHAQAGILVDGERVTGSITCTTGAFAPDCPADPTNPAQRNVEISLGALPAPGLHLLQVVSPKGMLSNEFPFTVQ